MKQAAVFAIAGTAAAFEVDQATLHAFDNYVAEYNKMYGTKEEYMFRLQIFADNVRKIQEHNEKYAEDNATLGVNHMADWTPQEYRRLLGFKGHVKRQNETENVMNQKMSEHLAKQQSGNDAAIDWREQGAVTPVKDQGQCGSCWAFSSTGAMEGAYYNKNSKLNSLSEQQLVDCATKEGNQGCNGGLMDYAFTYAESNKMDLEGDYPYTAKDGKSCKAKGTVDTLSGFQDVKVNDPVALSEALQKGPVSVAVGAESLAWMFYSGGIVHRGCGTDLDHGVLLVGQGSEGDTDYWIIKNSWGADWGEDGYIRVMRTMDKTGPGVCGEQQQASYPEY